MAAPTATSVLNATMAATLTGRDISRYTSSSTQYSSSSSEYHNKIYSNGRIDSSYEYQYSDTNGGLVSNHSDYYGQWWVQNSGQSNGTYWADLAVYWYQSTDSQAIGSSQVFRISTVNGSDFTIGGDAYGSALINDASGSGNDTLDSSATATMGPTLLGKGGDDILVGSDTHADQLFGGDGNDSLEGRGADDLLYGQLGNDTIDGGAGTDVALYFSAADQFTVTQAGAPDRYTISGPEGTDLLIGIEYIQFADVAPVAIESLVAPVITGTAGDDSLTGTAGNDSLDGLAGNDSLVGLAWNDTLQGGAGDDTLYGDGTGDAQPTDGQDILKPGTGADAVYAGGQNDSILLEADGTWGPGYAALNEGSPGVAGSNQQVLLDGKIRYTDYTDGSDGTDTVQLTDGNNAFFLHDALSLFNPSLVLVNDARQMPSIAREVNIETILAGGGDDIVDLTSADYATGAATTDGGAGNDVLWGNAGADKLIGGDGDDVLFGGAGNDTLNGGAGADIFQYVKNGGGNDVIEDFQPGVDKIQLFGAADASEVQIALAVDHVTLSWGDATMVLTGISSTTGASDWFQLG